MGTFSLKRSKLRIVWSHKYTVHELEKWMDSNGVVDKDKYRIWYNACLLHIVSRMSFEEIERRFKPDMELYGYDCLENFYTHLLCSHEALGNIEKAINASCSEVIEVLGKNGHIPEDLESIYVDDHEIITSVKSLKAEIRCDGNQALFC